MQLAALFHTYQVMLPLVLMQKNHYQSQNGFLRPLQGFHHISSNAEKNSSYNNHVVKTVQLLIYPERKKKKKHSTVYMRRNFNWLPSVSADQKFKSTRGQKMATKLYLPLLSAPPVELSGVGSMSSKPQDTLCLPPKRQDGDPGPPSRSKSLVQDRLCSGYILIN